MGEMMPLPPEGMFVGRVWRPGIGPALVVHRDGRLVDVTAPAAPTMRDLLEMDDPAGWIAAQAGEDIGALDDFAATAGARTPRGCSRPPTCRRSRPRA